MGRSSPCPPGRRVFHHDVTVKENPDQVCEMWDYMSKSEIREITKLSTQRHTRLQCPK